MILPLSRLLRAGALLGLLIAGCHKVPPPLRQPGQPSDAIQVICADRGMTKVTGRDLLKLGIDVKNVDTARMALVHYDQSVPFHGAGLDDGRFDPDDAIYFFSDGAAQDTIPYVNIEKDDTPRTQRFMLHLGPSRFKPEHFKPVSQGTAREKNAPAWTLGGLTHFEENPIYRFVDDDKPFQESTGITAGFAKTGTDYTFWKEMTFPPTNKTTSTAAVTIDLPQADLKHNVTLRIRLFTAADESYVTLEHRVAVTVNGKALGETSWTGVHEGIRTHDAVVQVPPGILKATNNKIDLVVLEPKILACTRPAKRFAIDFVLLDWIEADFRQAPRVTRDEGEFLVTGTEDHQAAGRMTLEGFSSKAIRVFDLGAREVLEATPFQQAGQSWAVNLERKAKPTTLAALSETRMHSPIEMKRVTLKERFTQPSDAELLILPHPAFTQQLEPLVAWKRARGLRTELVEITDLFNEAAGGYAGPETLRRYIEHVYKSQPQPALRYVLLVGDAMSVSKYQTFCPAWSYLQSGRNANENYFAAFDKPEGKPQVAVGRISANAPEQVSQIVGKIIDYESGKNAGPWQTRFLTIAASHQWARDDARNYIEQFVQPHYLSVTMQTDQRDPDRNYPQKISQRLSGLLNEGSLITVFIGHGGGGVWEVGPTYSGSEGDFHKHILDPERVAQMTNQGKLPLVCSMTCFTNDFENPNLPQSIGETFVNSAGGAIAVLGASWRTGEDDNEQILRSFMTAVRDRKPGERLGDYFLKAKLAVNKPINNMNYLLLGDPSLEFSLPQPDIRLENVVLNRETGTVAFDYELPAKVKVPAQATCFVASEDETLSGTWTATMAQKHGHITQPVKTGIAPAKMPEKIRVVVHAQGQRQEAHTGAQLATVVRGEILR